ncbi:probable serine/threonine-protein kinase DDB_G0283065 [Diaphorina citri]|uniref:Probable serine/threonine-protein kinase DDB_G0283065 n=1 Tax=Diaphorina citri TaxID=121845 RepID=A0A3Q0JGU7_DIACI|nr:probable serine/threonine-protein kinase DDB_G0283065 [Diaphorina citri]
MDLNDTKTELSRKMAETVCENQGNKDALEETNIGEVTDDNVNGNPGSTGNDLGDNDNINNENETSTVDLKDMKTVNVLNDIGGLQSTEMLTSNQKSDEENDKKSNEENYLETINKAMSDMVINEELPNSDLINTTNGNDLETTGNEESTNIENIILA